MYLSATGVSGVQPHQVMVPEAPEGPGVAEVVSFVEPPPPEHAASASEAAATAASAAALRVRNAPIPRWVMGFPLSSGPTSSLGPVWEKVPVHVVKLQGSSADRDTKVTQWAADGRMPARRDDDPVRLPLQRRHHHGDLRPPEAGGRYGYAGVKGLSAVISTPLMRPS